MVLLRLSDTELVKTRTGLARYEVPRGNGRSPLGRGGQLPELGRWRTMIIVIW